VAYGEIGLDFYHNHSPKEVQRREFARQLNLAAELELPVIIHDREAHQEVYDIIRAEGGCPHGGVIHCFSYSLAEAEAFLSLGLHISFCGQITFKKCDELRDVAKEIPLNKLLLETDCPFLSPVPMRGKRNEPANVKYIAEKHAEIRNISFEELEKATTENAVRLFGLDNY
jgi:TatD DNase family protein